MPTFTAVFWWTRGCGDPVCAALFIMEVVGVDVDVVDFVSAEEDVGVGSEDCDVDAPFWKDEVGVGDVEVALVVWRVSINGIRTEANETYRRHGDVRELELWRENRLNG
jgi:hypothetical protein